MSLRRPLGLSFAATLSISAVGMVTGVLLARGLGVNGRGELAAIILWPTLLGSIGSFGLANGITFRTARSRPDERQTIVGSSVALGLLLSAITVAVGIVIVKYALARHFPEAVGLSRLYFASVPLTAVGTSLGAVLNGLHSFGRFQASRLLGVGGNATALVVLALVHGFTVRNVVLAYLIVTALSCAATAALVVRAGVTRLVVSPRLMWDILSFGVKSHTGELSALLTLYLDQLVISLLLPPRELGLYVAAVSFTAAAGIAGSAVGLVALPAVSRATSVVEQRQYTLRVANATLIPSIAVTIPLLVAVPWLVRLFFGASFLPATASARILLLAAVFMSLKRVLGAALTGCNRPLETGIGETLALGVTVVALFLLVPAIGIVGAAVASLAAYGVGAVFIAWRLHRHLDVPIYAFLVPRADELAVARLRRLLPGRRRALAEAAAATAKGTKP